MNKFYWPIATTLLAISFLWSFSSPVGHDLTFGDIVDGEILVSGLERTQSWHQVLGWFYGTWIAGPDYPFYRPLTSLLWFLQWKAFGMSRYSDTAMISFVAVHWLSHFAVCMVAVGFLRCLMGGKIAILTMLLWSTSALAVMGMSLPIYALYHWKDSPDMWVSISIICSLWSLLSYMRTGERRFVIWVFIAQFVAIGFKEMSYVLPFMAMALVWFEHKQLEQEKRKVWGVVLGMFGVVIFAYIIRFWMLSGPGFRFGTNGSWLNRFLLNVGGGPFVNSAFLCDFAPIGLALVTVALILLFAQKKLSKPVIGLALSGILGLLVGGMETFYRFIVPIFSVGFLSGTALHSSALSGAFLILTAAWAWKRKDRRILFAWLWVFTAYLPLLTAPVTSHALYLSSIGWALWVGIVASSVIVHVLEKSALGHKISAISNSRTCLKTRANE
jgi:hypothetical protein